MTRPRAVVVVTGSELVRGDRSDLNGPFLARELVSLGVEPGPYRALARTRDRRLLVLAHDVARVVLVHVQLPVEPQLVGVCAQEALHVRLRGEDIEALFFERPEVPRADLRRLLDLVQLELLPVPRFTQAVADFEHGRARL